MKVGTIVRLKSGGPNMTISREPSSHHSGFGCKWFTPFTRWNAAEGRFEEEWSGQLYSGDFEGDNLEVIRVP